MVSFVTLATVFGTFVAFGRWLDGAITDEARNRILAALLEPWPVSRFAGIVQIVPDRLASILGSPFSAKFVLSSFLASVLCTAVLTASFAPWSDMAENVGWASAMKLTFFSFAIAAAFNVIADLFSNWETLYIVKRIGETRGTVAILFLVVLDLLLSGLLSVGLLAFFELVSSGSARDLIGESPYIISKKSADCWSSAVEPIETNKQDYIDTMVAVRRMQNIPIRKSDGSPILPGWVLEKHGRYKEAERRAMACIESERGGLRHECVRLVGYGSYGAIPAKRRGLSHSIGVRLHIAC